MSTFEYYIMSAEGGMCYEHREVIPDLVQLKDCVVQETYPFPNLLSFWLLTEKSGSLRLKGTAINFTTDDSPSFIGRRQAAFNLTASAKVIFIPKVENEEAGLVVRADDKNHYDLLIGWIYRCIYRYVCFR